jgi:hypothetical protein
MTQKREEKGSEHRRWDIESINPAACNQDLEEAGKD